VRDRHLDAFLARIWRELPPGTPVDPEPAARAVFRLLAERIAEGELEDVRHVLPGEIRELWGDGRRGEAVSASDQIVR
jgi:uncharacterized protein (DUF2267 family)